MAIIATIGTVLLTIGITRLAEYALFDLARENKGVWTHGEEIPDVAIEEV